MASIRGILNIQSLNDKRAHVREQVRRTVRRGAGGSRALSARIAIAPRWRCDLRAGETESAQRPERRRARPGRGAERCWCRPERRVRVLTECPGPNARCWDSSVVRLDVRARRGHRRRALRPGAPRGRGGARRGRGHAGGAGAPRCPRLTGAVLRRFRVAGWTDLTF